VRKVWSAMANRVCDCNKTAQDLKKKGGQFLSRSCGTIMMAREKRRREQLRGCDVRECQ